VNAILVRLMHISNAASPISKFPELANVTVSIAVLLENARAATEATSSGTVMTAGHVLSIHPLSIVFSISR